MTVPLLFLLACKPPASPIAEDSVTATLGEIIPSVATVTWTTDVATTAFVEFGPDETYGRTTPVSTSAALEHEVDLLGLRIRNTSHFRIVATTAEGEVFTGADHEVVVARGPSNLPEPFLLQPDDGPWGRWSLSTYDRVDTWLGGAMILDTEGNIVWYYDCGAVFVSTAQLSLDQRYAVLMVTEQLQPTASKVVYVALDGSSVEEIPTPYAHHALTIPDIPGVRFAYIAYVVQEWNGEDIVGDRIIEVLDDGTEREVWNAFDHLNPVARSDWDAGQYIEGPDWTHANGLYYEAETDTYVVSLYFDNVLVRLDRETGENVWKFGGTESDFSYVAEDIFMHQHAPESHGSSMYVFDNGVGGGPSRAAQYELDDDAWTATLVWESANPEGTRTGVLGDVDVLPDNEVAIAWGDAGGFTVVTREGDVTRSVDVEPGVITPTIQRFESFYP